MIEESEDYHFGYTVTDGGTRGVLVMVTDIATETCGTKRFRLREVTAGGALRDWTGWTHHVRLTTQFDAQDRGAVENCQKLYRPNGTDRAEDDPVAREVRGQRVRIPMIVATFSEVNVASIPDDRGQLSERSDANFLVHLKLIHFRQADFVFWPLFFRDI